MSSDKKSLIWDLAVGEIIDIHGSSSIQILKKSGQRTRIRIVAPSNVLIVKKNEQSENSDIKNIPSMAH